MVRKAFFLTDYIPVKDDGFVNLKPILRKREISTSFSMVYDGQLNFWFSLRPLEFKLMLFLMSINDINDKDNYIFFSSLKKKKLAGLLGVKVSSIENALTSLSRKGGIRRIDRSTYELNPEIATRNITKKDRINRVRLREEAKLRESRRKAHILSTVKENVTK